MSDRVRQEAPRAEEGLDAALADFEFPDDGVAVWPGDGAFG